MKVITNLDNKINTTELVKEIKNQFNKYNEFTTNGFDSVCFEFANHKYDINFEYSFEPDSNLLIIDFEEQEILDVLIEIELLKTEYENIINDLKLENNELKKKIVKL